MSSPKVRELQSVNRALHVKIEERDRQIGALEHKVHVLTQPHEDLIEKHTKELEGLTQAHQRLVVSLETERAELKATVLRLQAEIATQRRDLDTWMTCAASMNEIYSEQVQRRLGELREPARRDPVIRNPLDPSKGYMTARIARPPSEAPDELFGKPFRSQTGEILGHVIDGTRCADGFHVDLLIEVDDAKNLPKPAEPQVSMGWSPAAPA